jgi:hypothetical protein
MELRIMQLSPVISKPVRIFAFPFWHEFDVLRLVKVLSSPKAGLIQMKSE